LKKIKWMFGKEIEIPEEWEEPVPLNKYTSIKDGDWILEENYSEKGVRLLQIGDIGLGDFRDKSKKFISEKTASELKCTIIEQEKDILISRMPEPVGRACIAPILSHPYIVSVDIGILKIDKDKIDRKYLLHYLNSSKFLNYVLKYVAGTTRSRISRKNLENIPIILPPLPEQQKIGSILSNISELIQKQHKVIHETQKLLKGQMQKLLTKGIGHTKFKKVRLFPRYDDELIPENWNVGSVDSLLKIIDYRGRTPPFSNDGIPHLRSNNIRDNKINFDEITYVTKEIYDEYMTRGIPKENDVIFTTEGPLGETALIPKDFIFSLAQRIIILRPKTSELDPKFLKYILDSHMIKKRYQGLATGTTLSGIASKWFTKLLLVYPSEIIEQQKIASILSNLDLLIQQEKQYKEKLQKIKRGLMQQLLTGKTRVKV